MNDKPPRRVTFELTLFDDAAVHEKLTMLDPLETMFDDERNDVPDLYYELVNAPPGSRLRITVERLDTLPIQELLEE
jgi:hypothetical protein